jgi:copper chaperone NosL
VGNDSSEMGKNILLSMKQALLSLFVILLLAAGCDQTLQPIEYGKDDCHWCSMRIMDPKFGAEAITEKGRTYKFDSGECLLHYLNETETKHSHLVVTNFESAEQFLPAETAWFLVSESMPSPMGGYLNAFASAQIAKKYQSKSGGELFNWEAIKTEYTK